MVKRPYRDPLELSPALPRGKYLGPRSVWQAARANDPVPWTCPACGRPWDSHALRPFTERRAGGTVTGWRCN